MNSLQELLDNGIELYTAENMLKDYSNRIDTMNGIYKIIDINYDFSVRGKDVTLQCTECGKIIHRKMISGRNKWSELIKSCECQKEKKKIQRMVDLKKSQKIKKRSAESILGNEYGDYIVTDLDFSGTLIGVVLNCKVCGAERRVAYTSIQNGAWKDTKCHKHYNPIKFDESYIGRKNNYLKVIGITRLPNKHRAFMCECDCGNVTTVEPTHWEQGSVKSCGCLADSFKLKHSRELDRLRIIHSGMVQRCYNKNSEAYKNYGGRGIEICPEWHDRGNFIEWALNNGYSDELTIDRKDVNGNYEPSNCRWADWIMQANNRRPKEEWKERERAFEYDGIKYHLYELCEMFDTSEPAVRYRMSVMGMTLEEALKTPKYAMGRPRKKVSN